MANVPIRDSNAIEKFLKATGLGSDASPYIVEHKETNSAAILAAAQALHALLELGVAVTNWPEGASDPATETKQDAAIGHLVSLLALLTAGIEVTNLPADTATGDRQEAAIAHLATLVAGINADPATGTLQSAAIAHLASLVAAIGAPVDVASIAVPGAIYHGQTSVTTPGTAVALAATQALLSGLTVKARAANTGLVFVGASDVSSANGFELAAGEQLFIEVGDVATVFVDAAVGGEGVAWISS